MAITIEVPESGADVDVDTATYDSIAVSGEASKNNDPPDQVCAKIYPASTGTGDIPASPPGDATCTPAPTKVFAFTVPNAFCGTPPAQPVENKLVVWADYGDGNPDRAIVTFFGICT